MEKRTVNPEATIGLFLSDLDQDCKIVQWIKEAGYAVGQAARLDDGQVPSLNDFDALILSWSAWETLRPAIKEADGRRKDAPVLPVIILCPSDSQLSSIVLEEPREGLSLLPYPVEPAILLFQLQGALKAFHSLKEIRHRLGEREIVLNSISEVFFSVDHDFRYTFFNQQAQKVGSKTDQELLGQDMWEIFPFLKNTEFYQQMHRAAADRKILIAEYLGPITGGWFEMRIYPSAGGLSVLFVDISSRKKAEANLKKAQEQLTEANCNLERAVAERTSQLHAANEQLEELVYSIAHDLRSPLRGMQGFAQAFLDDFSAALDARAKEYGMRMTAAALFMDRMLTDLIELSKVTKSDLEVAPLSVATAWQSALLQHEEEIKRSAAKIETSPDLGRVKANRILLTQILANLLGNALKFRRPETPAEITIWTEQADPAQLDIYIRDNGIGIDSRYRDKIFRVFERLNGSVYPGTGIGLAIAKKAAERMKGHLDFTSDLGAGTTFRLQLPTGH